MKTSMRIDLTLALTCLVAGCLGPQLQDPYWQNEAIASRKAEEELKRLGVRVEDLPPLRETIVTAGPLSQPYEVLGEVHVNTEGMINFGSILNDALFHSPLERAAVGPTPMAHTETMNKMLRDEAIKLYGGKVDAVINATYRTDPDGDVYASGRAGCALPSAGPACQRERHRSPS